VQAKIGAVVLAAGRSSRMQGAHKLLLPWGGSTVIEATIANYLACFDPLVMVIGHQGRTLAKIFANSRVVLVENKHYASGMMGSIQVGVERLKCELDLAGFALALGDQPATGQKLLQELKEEFMQGACQTIVRPRSDGELGHPVLFPAHLMPLLLQQPMGDFGLKAFLNGFAVNVLDVKDNAVIDDIDTHLAYQTIRKKYEIL